MNELEETSSPSPSEIMEKTSPARLVETKPNRMPKASPAAPPIRGMTTTGTPSLGVDEGVHRVNTDKSAEAEINRVAERQEAGLSEQHVERQGENDHLAHDRHHRQR